MSRLTDPLFYKGAQALTDAELVPELRRMDDRFAKAFDDDGEGRGGSPGEWMVEWMGQLETEIKRRGFEVPEPAALRKGGG